MQFETGTTIGRRLEMSATSAVPKIQMGGLGPVLGKTDDGWY
jgi:hypothetical protein